MPLFYHDGQKLKAIIFWAFYLKNEPLALPEKARPLACAQDFADVQARLDKAPDPFD
jgi:hypothetical protein